MASSGKPRIRILLAFLGASLLVWGLTLSALGFFGALSDAEVLEITPVLTSPANEFLARYNLELNKLTYSFTTLDEVPVQSFCIRFKSSLSLQAFALRNPAVRYFEFLPELNAFKDQTGLSSRALVTSLIGLIFLILSPRRKRRRSKSA